MVKTILRAEKVSDAELTISFVTHQRIRAFNRQFLRRNHATDVLAFNLSESRRLLVADVIISIDAAISYARQHDKKLEEEIVLYVVHGVLHLLGYDDHQPTDIAAMRRKEEQLMGRLQKYVKNIII